MSLHAPRWYRVRTEVRAEGRVEVCLNRKEFKFFCNTSEKKNDSCAAGAIDVVARQLPINTIPSAMPITTQHVSKP